MTRRLYVTIKLHSLGSNALRSKRATSKVAAWRAALFIFLIVCSSRVEADDWHWLVGHHYAVDRTVVCLNKQAAIGLVKVGWYSYLPAGCIIAELGGFYPSLRIANSKMDNGESVVYVITGFAMEIEGRREYSGQKYINMNVYVVSGLEVSNFRGDSVSIVDPDFDK